MKRGSSKTVEIDSRNIFNWIGGGILFRKDLLIKVGLYRDLIFEEYDILLRAVECGEIGVVRIPLYNYYLHGGNMTSKDRYWINGVREFSRLKEIDLKSYKFSTVLVDPPRAGLYEGTIELI